MFQSQVARGICWIGLARNDKVDQGEELGSPAALQRGGGVLKF